MDADAPLSGRCLCGAIRWRAPGPVLWSGHCHCESCRRAASAAFVSYLGVSRESVAWEGEPRIYHSSPEVAWVFCPTCGSLLAYRNAKWPVETHLAAATLDDPARFLAKEHFHWSERVSWSDIHDGLRRHPHTADDIPAHGGP